MTYFVFRLNDTLLMLITYYILLMVVTSLNVK